MKRMTFAALAVALCAFSACSPSKDQVKKNFLKECNESGDKQFTDAKMRGYFHEYCECSAEKVVNKFSVAEIADFDKMKKDGKMAEIQAKLMPVIQPCLDELQQKAAAGMSK